MLPSVLVADDHQMIRERLVSLLRDDGFDVVGSVGDGGALLEAARQLRPDVIVTDISMPGLNGIEALARLTAENGDSKVVVLTMHHDAELAACALRNGAAGFVLKESAGDELVNALLEVLRGGTYLSAAIAGDVMSRMNTPNPPR